MTAAPAPQTAAPAPVTHSMPALVSDGSDSDSAPFFPAETVLDSDPEDNPTIGLRREVNPTIGLPRVAAVVGRVAASRVAAAGRRVAVQEAADSDSDPEDNPTIGLPRVAAVVGRITAPVAAVVELDAVRSASQVAQDARYQARRAARRERRRAGPAKPEEDSIDFRATLSGSWI